MIRDSYLNAAIAEAIKAPVGTPFVLKDMFKGIDWEQLRVGERLALGKDFKREVLAGRVPTVSYAGKAENNSAQYIRQTSVIAEAVSSN